MASALTLAVAVVGKKVVKKSFSTKNGQNMHFFFTICSFNLSDTDLIVLNQNVTKFQIKMKILSLKIAYFLQMRMSASCIM